MLPVLAVLKANILAKMRMGEQQILRVSEAHIFDRGTGVEHALNVLRNFCRVSLCEH